MNNLFTKQSESGLQWFVCKGCPLDYKIVWVEYKEQEAIDMVECFKRMYPCKKRRRKA